MTCRSAGRVFATTLLECRRGLIYASKGVQRRVQFFSSTTRLQYADTRRTEDVGAAIDRINRQRAAEPQPRNEMQDLVNSTLFSMNLPVNRGMFGLGSLEGDIPDASEPYHFHVYAHKHNTHVTVTKPNRQSIISVSCGNLGFSK